MSDALLVLWDIDHTLIDGGGVARRAVEAAFRRATGIPLSWELTYQGRTEIAATTELLRAHDLEPADGLMGSYLELLVAEMRDRAGDLADEGRALPGAREALAALAGLAGVRQSVLTGNLLALAELKLAAFDLTEHLDLRLGAYGEDAYERTDLPAHAFDRAERVLGRRFTGPETVIIGDTVRDVHTAHAVGARAVAVATGLVPAAELAAAGADVVLPDLADTAAVLAAVTGR
ncbi:HAD family hydrolase [Kitasatospora viridis]|uniref:Phosphoglycolate phosphatase-like HAD superfamily hydrolase n=1 Tax=Kitasatospora viridis TaxID=281105 RepID=A0A561UNH8_9ACTN|nr:haloacid dehalogenase-like hydrolase [Kitasatospora viridis]TWG00911.1 phosphoglycolate phosphatase-like HAD superfamily hydrolase [Kitasatospora viridis]